MPKRRKNIASKNDIQFLRGKPCVGRSRTEPEPLVFSIRKELKRDGEVILCNHGNHKKNRKTPHKADRRVTWTAEKNGVAKRFKNHEINHVTLREDEKATEENNE